MTAANPAATAAEADDAEKVRVPGRLVQAAVRARFPTPGYGARPVPGVIPIGVAPRGVTRVDPYSLPDEGGA